MPTGIFLAQSNYLIREGLKSLIFNSNGLLFKGEASSAEELLTLAPSLAPDLVIIDHLDTSFGISVVRKLKAALPEATILTITDCPNRWMLSDALAAGVNSYLLRDCEKEEILDAIHTTAKGDQFFCGKILSEVIKNQDEVSSENDAVSCEGIKVSVRESEIIRLIAEGMTNKEIADKLFISAHTVTTHRKNIMAKLGVNNTAGLVLFAIKNNILTPNHFLFNTN
ncbi:MAG TPA: response regulator transcription factor [Bacteroidia bacterium]|nr:response regulator transcription factor [Bacteroidia bacterium]